MEKRRKESETHVFARQRNIAPQLKTEQTADYPKEKLTKHLEAHLVMCDEENSSYMDLTKSASDP